MKFTKKEKEWATILSKSKLVPSIYRNKPKSILLVWFVARTTT